MFAIHLELTTADLCVHRVSISAMYKAQQMRVSCGLGTCIAHPSAPCAECSRCARAWPCLTCMHLRVVCARAWQHHLQGAAAAGHLLLGAHIFMRDLACCFGGASLRRAACSSSACQVIGASHPGRRNTARPHRWGTEIEQDRIAGARKYSKTASLRHGNTARPHPCAACAWQRMTLCCVPRAGPRAAP